MSNVKKSHGKLLKWLGIIFTVGALIFLGHALLNYITSRNIFFRMEYFSFHEVLYRDPELLDLKGKMPESDEFMQVPGLMFFYADDTDVDQITEEDGRSITFVPVSFSFASKLKDLEIAVSVEDADTYYDLIHNAFETTPGDLSYFFSSHDTVSQVSTNLLIKNLLSPTYEEVIFFQDQIVGLLYCKEDCNDAVINLITQVKGKWVYSSFFMKSYTREEVYDAIYTLNQHPLETTEHSITWDLPCLESMPVNSALSLESPNGETFEVHGGMYRYCFELTDANGEKFSAYGVFRNDFFNPILFLDEHRILYTDFCGTGCKSKSILDFDAKTNEYLSALGGLELSPDQKWMLEYFPGAITEFTHFVRLTNLETLETCDLGEPTYPNHIDQNWVEEIAWGDSNQLTLTVMTSTAGVKTSEQQSFDLELECER